jgi:hypothetical protein
MKRLVVVLLILTACTVDGFTGQDGAVEPDALLPGQDGALEASLPPDGGTQLDGSEDATEANVDGGIDSAVDAPVDAPNDGAPWNTPWYNFQCNYKDAGTNCDSYHDWLCRQTCSGMSPPKANCACVTNSYCYCP